MSATAPAAKPAGPTLKQDATVISLVGFAHGTSHFFHLMLPPLFPWFMAEFGLGFAAVGVLTSVFYTVSGIGQAFAGILVDRYGAHKVLCGGIATLTLSGIVVGLATGFNGLLLAAFLAGLGNCIFHPADYALLNHRVSPARMGHAFSTHGICGNIGWALAPLLMTALAASYGWRSAGLGAALFGALSLSLLIWKRDLLQYELAAEFSTSGQPAGKKSNTWAFLQTRMVWLAFAFFFFITYGFGALQNFAPALLRELYDLSLLSATSALSTYLLGGSLGLLAGGFLAAPGRSYDTTVTRALAGGAVLALVLGSQVVPGLLVIPVMAVMGFVLGLAGPSRDLLVRQATKARLGEAAFGRVYGMVYSGLDVGLALAPVTFGILLDRHLPQWVFVGFALSLSLSILAARALSGDTRKLLSNNP